MPSIAGTSDSPSVHSQSGSNNRSNNNDDSSAQQRARNLKLRNNNNRIHPNSTNIISSEYNNDAQRTPVNGENWRQNLAERSGVNYGRGKRNALHSSETAAVSNEHTAVSSESPTLANSQPQKTAAEGSSSLSASSSSNSCDEDNSRQECAAKQQQSPATQPLFPVPNSHAFAAATAVILYSATFLLYAQRHRLVLLIMTGLIGVCIILLYMLGILSFIYLMLRIQEMEKDENDSRQNIAFITVNNSIHGHNNNSISGEALSRTVITIDNKLSKNASTASCHTTVSSAGSATVMEMKL